MKGGFGTSAVAMLVLSTLLGFVVRGVLLANDHARLPDIMRSREAPERMFPCMILAHVFLSQGLRYGIAVAVLAWLNR